MYKADNCQAVVDAMVQIIIAADVTQASNDKQQAQPLLQQAIANTRQVPKIASLDAAISVRTISRHSRPWAACL